MKIVENKAKCRLCGDIVYCDKDAEKVNYCSCGAIGVSGGYESIMRLGHHKDIIEMSVKDYTSK